MALNRQRSRLLILRRFTGVAMSVLVLQPVLVGSGLMACGAASAGHAAVLPMSGMHPGSLPCGTTPARHDGGCSQPGAPADCGSTLACASPIAAMPFAVLARAATSHLEPASADDLAPPARTSAPEPPPPRA